MSRTSALLLLTLLAHVSCAGIGLADEPLASFKGRWKLALLPDTLPEIGAVPVGTEWIQAGPMNILGKSTDRLIRFPTAMVGPSRLELSVIDHAGFGDKPDTVTTEKHSFAIYGPFLECAGRVRSIHVRDQQLVLGDVIQIGPRNWYSLRVDPVESRDKESGKLVTHPDHWNVHEYLWEFAADPLTEDRGEVTSHVHRYDSRDNQGHIQQMQGTFALVLRAGDPTETRRISSTYATLLFQKGQSHASLDNTIQSRFVGDGVFLQKPSKKNPTE